MKKLLAAVTLVGVILFGQGTAHAIPVLQLYIEGATYDPFTQTWVWIGGTEDIPRLWAIGNVSGPGGHGTIENVRLSVAYSQDFTPTIVLTPTQVGGLAGSYTIPPTGPVFTDASLPTGTGTLIRTVVDGTAPLLGDGSSLPTHGIYGPLTHWQEFDLGDFTLTDSPIADFTGPTPTDFTLGAGQINAYDVNVTDWSGETLHFDLYNHYEGRNHGRFKFAPFSHDGDAVAPEPASFIIWFLIGLSWVGSAWTHQYRRRWKKWQQEEAAAAAGTYGDDQSARLPADQTEAQVGGQSAGSTAAG